MANYDIQIDSTSGITHVIVRGSILITDLTEFLNSEAYFQRSNKVIWDITGATMTEIPTDEFVASIRKVSHISRRNIRAAFVYHGDVDYGLGRMFKVYAELNHFAARINIFQDMDEAIHWLTTDNQISVSE